MNFLGYKRANGSVGIRNYVAIIPTIGCANEIAFELASKVKGVNPMLHNHACIRVGPDLKRAEKTLVGMGSNPNIHSVLLVGIGCEGIKIEEIAEKIKLEKKRVEMLSIEKDGGYQNLIDKGITILSDMVAKASDETRVSCDIKNLTIGIKCGGSGSISAISSNPSTGKASDILVSKGGKVIFSETAELIGAEKVLAKRATGEDVANKLLNFVNQMNKDIYNYGVDILGSEPTKGNIQGGLTTIEEKSLGAIAKGGTTPLMGALEYGEKPQKPGLYFMDGTTQASQLFLGMFTAGAQLQIFSFAGGLPARFRGLPSYPCGLSTLPVIKILGSPEDISEKQYFDVYAGDIINGDKSIDEVGEEIFQEIISVSSGKLTVTEKRTNYKELLQFYANGVLM